MEGSGADETQVNEMSAASAEARAEATAEAIAGATAEVTAGATEEVHAQSQAAESVPLPASAHAAVEVRRSETVGVVKPFVQYTVVSASGTASVLRRYSDFLWLHERLVAEHQADCDIPVLPPKQLVGRFGETFLETRRAELETYMKCLMMDSELAGSVFTALFLRADDDTLAAKRDQRLANAFTRARLLASLNNTPMASHERLVRVLEPTKVGGSVPHTQYRVSSRHLTNGKERAVWRRFSDFEWLHGKLSEELTDGSRLPELPAKQLTGRFEAAFVEARRAELENLIEDILSVDGAGSSLPMTMFLLATDDVFARREKPLVDHSALSVEAFVDSLTSSPKPSRSSSPLRCKTNPAASKTIRVIDFDKFKAEGSFPRLPACAALTRDLAELDIGRCFVVYVSHKWTTAEDVDTATHEKYQLCVSGIADLWRTAAPDMEQCVVWMDCACCESGRPADLVAIMRSVDLLFTPILAVNTNAGETINDWMVDYRAADWNGEGGYVSSAWGRLEMFYCSNIPLINPSLATPRGKGSTSRTEKFRGSLKHYMSLDLRPHVIYGKSEMVSKHSALFLDPLSNLFFEMYDPLKATDIVAEERGLVDSLVEQLRPYLKSLKPGYEGPFKFYFMGPKHGRGKEVFANGDVYEGDFADGRREGTGVYAYSNGNVYTGEWKEGGVHGKGAMKYANGNAYEGDWVNNLRTGVGLYTWSNGTDYEGGFLNGLPLGMGKLQCKQSDPYAQAGAALPLGSVYVGEFVGGLREGLGTATYPSGDVYCGEWKRNVWHGQGLLTYADGRVQQGECVEGSFKQENH